MNNLISLRKLFLGGNQIKEIKSSDNLKNLRVLRLDINFEISEIKGLDTLKKLEELHLEVNSLTEIKDLEELSNLIKLDLSNNQIKEIKGLDNLTKLMELNLFCKPNRKNSRLRKSKGAQNVIP